MVRALKKTPTPIIFLLLCFLCPTEFSIFVGDIRLPPHRIALLVLIPVAVTRLMTRSDIRLRAFDGLFLLFGVWMVGSYTYHGFGLSGFIYGGSLALETTGTYLIARAWVRDVDTLRHTLKVALGVVIVAALIALPETLFGHVYTHDFLAKLTGYHHPTSVHTRLGLTRAYGTFDHPIHYGTFCAALLAMFWYVERGTFGRLRRSAIVSGATFLGLSSAPILCLGIQAGLITWERLTRGLSARVWLTLGAMVAAYVVVSLLATRSPITILATKLTLDSSTGFYRLIIWDHGLKSVFAHPMLGIGLADWARPDWMASDTIDAFWLLTAMRSGLPSVFLLIGALAFLVYAVNKRGVRNKSALARGLSRGWLFSLIALCFIATTVHFWNVSLTFFFFFIGLAGALADPKRKEKKRGHPARREAPIVPTPVGYGGRLEPQLAHGPQPLHI